MRPRHPIACLDCQATDNALARRAFERRVAVLTTAALLLTLFIVLVSAA